MRHLPHSNRFHRIKATNRRCFFFDVMRRSQLLLDNASTSKVKTTIKDTEQVVVAKVTIARRILSGGGLISPWEHREMVRIILQKWKDYQNGRNTEINTISIRSKIQYIIFNILKNLFYCYCYWFSVLTMPHISCSGCLSATSGKISQSFRPLIKSFSNRFFYIFLVLTGIYTCKIVIIVLWLYISSL